MKDLNDAFFAYPALKKFPINTKQATLDSFGAYKVQRNNFNDSQRKVIEENLNKAAAYYELDMSEPEPVKEEPLMFKGAAEEVDMNEIKSQEDFLKARDFILEKRASTTRASLAEPAKYVLWYAANHDVDLDSPEMRKIAHIAGIGVGDREKIEYELEKRATLNIFSGKDKKEFLKFAKSMKDLSDEDFYQEKNLVTLCDVIDDIDFMYGNQHKHASDLGYPEDIVFSDTMDDLLKQASDLYYVPSIDATLSKKATLERADSINSFFEANFADYEALEGEKLIEKVASLDENTANALLEGLE